MAALSDYLQVLQRPWKKLTKIVSKYYMFLAFSCHWKNIFQIANLIKQCLIQIFLFLYIFRIVFQVPSISHDMFPYSNYTNVNEYSYFLSEIRDRKSDSFVLECLPNEVLIPRFPLTQKLMISDMNPLAVRGTGHSSIKIIDGDEVFRRHCGQDQSNTDRHNRDDEGQQNNDEHGNESSTCYDDLFLCVKKGNINWKYFFTSFA